jgi:predicted GIY-YIG superfamily endonuclease
MARQAALGFRLHHHVYVVRLDAAVRELPKFLALNPQYDRRKPCVYVGLTGLTPEARFNNHRRGHKASRIVKRFGVRLVPSLYSRYNPMSYEEAVKRERALARELRRRGYGVWQH